MAAAIVAGTRNISSYTWRIDGSGSNGARWRVYPRAGRRHVPMWVRELERAATRLFLSLVNMSLHSSSLSSVETPETGSSAAV